MSPEQRADLHRRIKVLEDGLKNFGIRSDDPQLLISGSYREGYAVQFPVGPPAETPPAATPPEEVFIVDFGDVIIVDPMSGTSDSIYGPYNPDGGVSGEIAHLAIGLSGDGDTLPTNFTVVVKVDGVPITFGGLTSISVPVPTPVINVLADPGQTFTAASDITFEIHEEGDPLLDLGSFTITLFGYV